jgi:Killing trait
MRTVASASSVAIALSSSDIANVGLAPSFAMGLAYLAGADSVGLLMGNATASQQRGRVLADAALANVLALIVTKGTTGK